MVPWPRGIAESPVDKPEGPLPAATSLAGDGAVRAGDDLTELEDEEADGEDEVGVSISDEAVAAERELEEEGRRQADQNWGRRAPGAEQDQVELR